MNCYSCRFSPPNDWMKMPENECHVLYEYPVAPQLNLLHSYTSNLPFCMNNTRKMQPHYFQDEFFRVNGKIFPRDMTTMRPFSSYGWNMRPKNSPRLIQHCNRNEMPRIRMPHCNVPRFNYPPPQLECDTYHDQMIHKEPVSHANNFNKGNVLQLEADHLKWNNFANDDVFYDPTHIPSNVPNQSTSASKLQNDKVLSNLCEDLNYVQCSGEETAITGHAEENFTSCLNPDPQTENFNDLQGEQETLDQLELSCSVINAENNLFSSELAKAYETMDGNALAAYFLNELHPSSPPAVNEVLESSLTILNSEDNEKHLNVVTEECVNCLDSTENNENQIRDNFEPKDFVTFDKISKIPADDIQTKENTLQEIETLQREERLSLNETNSIVLEFSNSSYGNERNYFDENDQKRKDIYIPVCSKRLNKSEDNVEKLEESHKLKDRADNKQNPKISEQKFIPNMTIINTNEQNRTSADDSALCTNDSTQFLDGRNDDTVNFGILSCARPLISIMQKGFSEELKSPQIPAMKSLPEENCVAPNSYSSTRENWNEPSTSKEIMALKSTTSNVENISTELNSYLDANFLNIENLIAPLQPHNIREHLNTISSTSNIAKLKEPDFIYSCVLDLGTLVSPVETSLSSVTNYLLDEPTDSIGKKEIFALEDYDISYPVLEKNAKWCRKKQKAIKGIKRSSLIQVRLPTPKKFYYEQEVINSSVMLLDNIFESDVDEYLDFEDAPNLRRSRKGKMKNKKEERKSTSKYYEELSNPSTKAFSPESLNYDAEDFKSAGLNKDSSKSFKNGITPTVRSSNDCPVRKRDAQTQRNNSGEIHDAVENLKLEQKVSQNQYFLRSSKNSQIEENAVKESNGHGSNFNSKNLRKRSLKKPVINTGNASKITIKSDSDNSTNDNSDREKNISKTSRKKTRKGTDQKLSSDENMLDNVKTCSEVKNTVSEENAYGIIKNILVGSGRNGLKNAERNLNKNMENVQFYPNDKKSNRKTNRMIPNKQTDSNEKDKINEIINCNGVHNDEVTTSRKLNNLKKNEKLNEKQSNSKICRGEESTFRKPLKIQEIEPEPIGYRLRKRNQRKP